MQKKAMCFTNKISPDIEFDKIKVCAFYIEVDNWNKASHGIAYFSLF